MNLEPDPAQAGLFDGETMLPHGLVYQAKFLTRDEESALIDAIAGLALREARFREYFARRRVAHFHEGAAAPAYDDGGTDAFSSGPLPPFLAGLRVRVAEWLGLAPTDFVHALVSEYRPGTPIGWHRDKADYGIVVGVSLAGEGRMRFRPLADRQRIVVLPIAARSAYVMRDDIRWQWQHSMLPTRELRYSITLRTAAQDAAAARWR